MDIIFVSIFDFFVIDKYLILFFFFFCKYSTFKIKSIDLV